MLSEIVECTPKIIDRVSRNDGNDERDGFNSTEIVEQSLCLRIPLGRDFIGIGIKECLRSSTKIENMFVGPFNFQFYWDKSIFGIQMEPLLRIFFWRRFFAFPNVVRQAHELIAQQLNA